MKDKLIAALRARHAGLSNSLYENLAAELAAGVTEESNIPEYLDTLNTGLFIKVLQSETDRRVSDARRTFEAKPPVAEPPTPTPALPADSNAQLLAQVLAQGKRLEKFENDQRTQGLNARLATKMIDEKIPAAFARGIAIDKDEDVDTAFNAAKAEWQAIQQQHIDQKIQVNHQPGAASPPAGAKDLTAAVKSYVASQKPASAK